MTAYISGHPPCTVHYLLLDMHIIVYKPHCFSTLFAMLSGLPVQNLPVQKATCDWYCSLQVLLTPITVQWGAPLKAEGKQAGRATRKYTYKLWVYTHKIFSTKEGKSCMGYIRPFRMNSKHIIWSRAQSENTVSERNEQWYTYKQRQSHWGTSEMLC